MSKDDFFELLAQDQIKKVIDLLQPLCRYSITHYFDWVKISSRYNRLVRQNMNGVISSSEYDLSINKIRDHLLNFIELLFKPKLSCYELFKSYIIAVGFWPITFSLMTIILIWFMMSPVKNANFRAELKVSSLGFNITEDWPYQFSVLANYTFINHITRVDGRTWNTDTALTKQQYLNLVLMDTSEISEIKIKNTNSIFLRLHMKEISMRFEKAAHGKLSTFRAKALIRTEDNLRIPSLVTNPNEAIQWTTSSRGSVVFSPINDSAFRIDKLKISSIYFNDIDNYMESSILSGTLSIQGRKNLELQPHDLLKLTDINSADLSIHQVDDTFKIIIKGKAKEISCDTSNEEESLKPMLIESFYHNDRYYFLGTMLVVDKF